MVSAADYPANSQSWRRARRHGPLPRVWLFAGAQPSGHSSPLGLLAPESPSHGCRGWPLGMVIEPSAPTTAEVGTEHKEQT